MNKVQLHSDECLFHLSLIMMLCPFLLVLFVLWDGEPGLTEAKPSVYKAVEGGDRSVTCRSYQTLNVSKRMFCRNDCDEEDILVETSGNKQENGRYSLKHEKKGSPPVDMMTVKITNVTRSDAGRYRCFYNRPVNSSYSEFIIEVTEVYTVAEGGTFTHSCLFHFIGNKTMFCKKDCSKKDVLLETSGNNQKNGRYSVQYYKYSDMSKVNVRITNVSSSDTGPYKCVLDKSSYTFRIKVTFAAASSAAPFTVSPSEVPPGQSPAAFSTTPSTSTDASLLSAGVPVSSIAQATPSVASLTVEATASRTEIESAPLPNTEVTSTAQAAASSAAPFTVSPSEVPPGQSPAAFPKHFDLWLVIVVVVAVAIILAVVSLIVYKKRRSRNGKRTTENRRDADAEETSDL